MYPPFTKYGKRNIVTPEKVLDPRNKCGRLTDAAQL